MKNTFHIVTLILSLLISSASFALDDEDHELFLFMDKLVVSSPKRPSTNQRPGCPPCEKSPQRSSSAPILKRKDHDVAVIVQSPQPMAPEFPLAIEADLSDREDHLMHLSPSAERIAPPGIENTPPRKRKYPNASALENGDPDALPSPSSKPSPLRLRAKNLFADDEGASPKINNPLKRNAAADGDDDFEERTFLRRPPHQKKPTSKRGRR